MRYQIKRKGIIMVTVMLLMPICIMLGAIMISNMVSEKHFLQYEASKGQSFYLAETGLNAAYYSFSESTFTGFTHLKDNDDTDPNSAGIVSGNPLVVSDTITDKIPFTRVAGGEWDGWYEYEWSPGDGGQSLTHSAQKESIHFRVSRTYDGNTPGSTRPTSWEIVCIAELGATRKIHRLSGALEGLSTHAIFDNGNLNEFIRGQNQEIRGKVHANGDIYLKPSGTTLSVITETEDGEAGFTASGKIWWGVDATGRTNMGTVRIDRQGPLSGSDNWPSNFDSRSSNWVTQAPALWGNLVKDEKLGAATKNVPPVKSFEPGGFYSNSAASGGLNISVEGGQVKVGNDQTGTFNIGSGPLSSAVTTKNFYNHAEKRYVSAVQIDVSKLSSDDYANGLIYSEKPLVLINAQKLPHATSIVSQSGIYTAGDFNKELATQDDYNTHQTDPTHTTKVPAALMTKDRLWHVSKKFPFSNSASSNYRPTADDPEEYSQDNEYVNRETGNDNKNVIEINGMLLDGAPLHDETWNRKIETDSETGEIKIVPKWGPENPDPGNGSASWDDFLEYHSGSRVVKKRGSIIHLQNADMAGVAAFNDSQAPIADGETAWYHRVCYDPPYRDYGYDILLKTSPPPFAPYVAKRAMWKRF